MKILMVVCDTLRVDHLGCYGYFRDTSSHIDYIAKEGTVFEDFYNSGAPTGPGFSCLYTGLHTIHHKFYRFIAANSRQVDDTIFTMAEILRAVGYTTAAVDNLVSLPSHPKHFLRGFEFYINPSPSIGSDLEKLMVINSEEVNRRAIPWIQNHSDEDFFLLIHYWDPHIPYRHPKKYHVFSHEKGKRHDLEFKKAPAGYQYVSGWGKDEEYSEGKTDFRGKTVSIDLYDGEIFYMDHAIGQIVSTLEDEGILNDTLIMITSDHGEQLGQHNYWDHDALHDTVTHVPLILKYPNRIPRGTRVKGFCQHIDVLPTILELVGVQTEVLDLDGVSIMPLLNKKMIRDQIFMEFSSGQRAIRTDEWKLIDYDMAGKHRRRTELYNIKDDPMETINLARIENKMAKSLKETINKWVKLNLKEDEPDPALYEDQNQKLVREKHLEYRGKMKDFMSSLNRGYIK